MIQCDLPCTHGRIDAVEIVYIETAVEEAGGIGFLRKLFPGAIVMAYASLQPGDEAQYIALFFFKTIAQAFCHASWVTNPVDLAPAYTALITAVCETCVMCLGVVTPLVIDILTPDVYASCAALNRSAFPKLKLSVEKYLQRFEVTCR
nr:hypothetical protein BaRGS_030117 [Batillaria attramentaria]